MSESKDRAKKRQRELQWWRVVGVFGVLMVSMIPVVLITDSLAAAGLTVALGLVMAFATTRTNYIAQREYDGSPESIARICAWVNDPGLDDPWVSYLSDSTGQVDDPIFHGESGTETILPGDIVLKIDRPWGPGRYRLQKRRRAPVTS